MRAIVAPSIVQSMLTAISLCPLINIVHRLTSRLATIGQSTRFEYERILGVVRSSQLNLELQSSENHRDCMPVSR
jgi:hypothetical protein